MTTLREDRIVLRDEVMALAALAPANRDAHVILLSAAAELAHRSLWPKIPPTPSLVDLRDSLTALAAGLTDDDGARPALLLAASQIARLHHRDSLVPLNVLANIAARANPQPAAAPPAEVERGLDPSAPDHQPIIPCRIPRSTPLNDEGWTPSILAATAILAAVLLMLMLSHSEQTGRAQADLSENTATIVQLLTRQLDLANSRELPR